MTIPHPQILHSTNESEEPIVLQLPSKDRPEHLIANYAEQI